MKEIVVKKLIAAGLAATAADTELDLRKYFVSPGKREAKAVLVSVWGGAGSDSGTLDVKIQESSTTVDSDFVDITSAAFTQIGDGTTSAPEELHFLPTKCFVRTYHTVAGTGTHYAVCNLSLLSRTM
jgi:hypothetical protein